MGYGTIKGGDKQRQSADIETRDRLGRLTERVIRLSDHSAVVAEMRMRRVRADAA
jgi:hypothetical protein